MNRTVRFLVLIQALWWFGYFAPGHQRGAILVPGAAASGSCCAASDSTPTCHIPGDGSDRLPDDPVKRCAVCYLVAHLDAPSVVDLSLPPLGLIDALPVAGDEVPAPGEAVRMYLGRAPPL